jgi:hypothetical protein
MPDLGLTFKGCYRRKNYTSLTFQISTAGRCTSLGQFQPDAAEAGARLYDAVQLLLRGPHADTNFEWSSYTQADVAAAALFLEAKGLDVHQTVAATWDAKGACGWTGVTVHGGSCRPSVKCWAEEKGDRTTKALAPGGLQGAEAAAHQADCAYLATRGLGCTTNFPASTYSQQQLQETGDYAISKGVPAAHVAANLEAVQQVCGLGC